VARRLLIDRGRGDEDILSGAPGKGRDVARHLFRGKGHELADHVEGAFAERGVAIGRIHVAGDGLDTLGQADTGLAAIEDGDRMPGSHRLLDARKRNLPGAADVKNTCQDGDPPPVSAGAKSTAGAWIGQAFQ
jgi:hypothetical protein